MILGVGIDLVQISRIGEVIARWKGRFLDRIFTPAEQAYCFRHREPSPHFAARFAAKEAMVKALGWNRDDPFSWSEIETVNDASGRPHLQMSGQVRLVADRLGVARVWVSLSHDHDYAVAHVMLTQGE
jgi:holo-[acyl-carrier protein] synthase